MLLTLKKQELVDQERREMELLNKELEDEKRQIKNNKMQKKNQLKEEYSQFLQNQKVSKSVFNSYTLDGSRLQKTK